MAKKACISKKLRTFADLLLTKVTMNTRTSTEILSVEKSLTTTTPAIVATETCHRITFSHLMTTLMTRILMTALTRNTRVLVRDHMKNQMMNLMKVLIMILAVILSKSRLMIRMRAVIRGELINLGVWRDDETAERLALARLRVSAGLR